MWKRLTEARTRCVDGGLSGAGKIVRTKWQIMALCVAAGNVR